MNQPTVTEQPVLDNHGEVVPPEHPWYGYWLGVQDAHIRWMEEMWRSVSNPTATALRQRMIKRQQLWLEVADDIASGVVSPRAMHNLYNALRKALGHDGDNATMKKVRLQLALTAMTARDRKPTRTPRKRAERSHVA